MNAVMSFLAARLSERTSRVQLITLVLAAGVITGLVTLDQIDMWTAQIVAMSALIGPIAGVLTPEPKPEAIADAVVKAAVVRAVERVPGLDRVSDRVDDLASAVAAIVAEQRQ